MSLGLVDILKVKFDQDLCLNFGKLNSILGSVVPLAMFTLLSPLTLFIMFKLFKILCTYKTVACMLIHIV